MEPMSGSMLVWGRVLMVPHVVTAPRAPNITQASASYSVTFSIWFCFNPYMILSRMAFAAYSKSIIHKL